MRLIFLLCLFLSLPVRAETDWEKTLTAWCQRNGVEQASVVLVGSTGLPRFWNYGKSTQTTPYVLASCSKSFTALAIAQQIEAKKLALDEPVVTYLPYFRLSDGGEKVTVRQLLCHASGLPRSAGQRRYPGRLEEAVKVLADVPLVAQPGQRHEYSNANYMVLGCILEAVSGQPYGEYVKARILQPLGMNLSEVGSIYGRPSVEPYQFASAGVTSTSEDMALYLKAQLAPANLKLQQALLPKIEYGFGWFCDAAGNWANHSGEFFGGLGNFQSFMALRPKNHAGFVVLSKLRKGLPSPHWAELEPVLIKAAL